MGKVIKLALFWTHLFLTFPKYCSVAIIPLMVEICLKQKYFHKLFDQLNIGTLKLSYIWVGLTSHGDAILLGPTWGQFPEVHSYDVTVSCDCSSKRMQFCLKDTILAFDLLVNAAKFILKALLSRRVDGPPGTLLTAQMLLDNAVQCFTVQSQCHWSPVSRDHTVVRLVSRVSIFPD